MENQPEGTKPFGENRVHTRERVKIKVQYKNIEKLREDWAENIGFGGMFIRSGNPLPIQTPVEVSLMFPDHEKTVILAAEVVRTVDQREAEEQGLKSGFALEFLDFIKKKKELEDFIGRLSGTEAQPSGAVINLGPPPDEPISKKAASPPQEDNGDAPAESPEHIEIKAIQIKNMSVKDKMILAPKADKAERAVLLRELNASVARLIIRNPRITESEIAQIAKDFAAPSDVLEMIAKNRKWIQNSDIRIAIVKNPRTPTPLAVAQLNYLQVKDLAMLAKSQSVRETVKNEAFKLLLKKRDKAT
ncbi:MAG: PilZ domain-containing protein [Deltaproteobacteria bacterium]|nr:PilZ domain-containing protein [Candidatus Zymogenaceae bacterium]